MSKHFEDVIEILGGEVDTKNHHVGDGWEFISALYRTPAGDVKGHYISLKSDCNWSEANGRNISNWNRWSGNSGYTAIVTDKSKFLKVFDRSKHEFKCKDIVSSRELLRRRLFGEISLKGIPREEYFLDPYVDILINNNESIKIKAIDGIMNWITDEEENKIENTHFIILRADAGVGKTTISRMLANNIIDIKTKKIVPLLIESNSWKNIIASNFSLENIWDSSIRRTFSKIIPAMLNDTALNVLVREGLFVIIFDGFDELCLNPNAPYKPVDIIRAMNDMLEVEGSPKNAKIILTTRDTYWRSIEQEIDDETKNKYKELHLNGFNTQQRKSYFDIRRLNPQEIDLALRISKSINLGMTGGKASEDLSEDRLAGVPYILDLIAHYVKDGNQQEINPYGMDPLELLLEAVCKRENIRQELNIEYIKQMEMFEYIFMEKGDLIPEEDLYIYAKEFINPEDNIDDIFSRLKGHFFFKNRGDGLIPRHDAIKIYFMAKYLSDKLIGPMEGSGIPIDTILNMVSDNPDKIDQILERVALQIIAIKKGEFSLIHAYSMLKERIHDGRVKATKIALYMLAMKILSFTKDDKNERKNKLVELIGRKFNENSIIENIEILGNLKTLDFSNVTFRDCNMDNVEFRNCIFNNSKLLNCKIGGKLDFINCTGVENLIIDKCDLSPEAQYSYYSATDKKIDIKIKQKLAEKSLIKALNKFKTHFGYLGTILFENRYKGWETGDKYCIYIWDALFKINIIENHFISGTTDGGINIVKTDNNMREIQKFMDSGLIGKNLKKVIDLVVKKI